MISRHRSALTLALVLGVAALVPARDARAGAYPTNACSGKKMAAAAAKCAAGLKAWAGFETSGDTGKRDEALGKALEKFNAAWEKADLAADKKGAECPFDAAETAAIVDATVNDVVTSINAVLTLPADAKCGAALIKAAGSKCAAVLKAEGKNVQSLAKDPTGAKLDAARDKATSKLTAAFSKQAGCPAAALEGDIQTALDEASEDVVFVTTNSSAVPQTWTEITPSNVDYEGRTLKPICSRQTPYKYFVKRGSTNKLLMYYQGGGACWDGATCDPSVSAFDDEVTNADNPANPPSGQSNGFSDYTNPNNPFAEWNVVFISYCTGDVHWGDWGTAYSGISGNFGIAHRGFVNAKVVEKWAREHFVNPERVFVTGSSAGAYGAALHGTLLHEVFPASDFAVLGDAGNGVITDAFLENSIEQQWHVLKNLPNYIPGLDVSSITQLSITDLWAEAASYYTPRGSRFATYTTAYDGGDGGQTFFYSVMVDGIPTGLSWWNKSCEWNTTMKAYALETASRASNFRYYIGTGSRHTMFGTGRVYTDTTGGVPTVVDWVNAMIDDTPAWTNVEATNQGLLLKGACNAASPVPGAPCDFDSECSPGTCSGEDPKPVPLAGPFQQVGPNVEIVCP